MVAKDQQLISVVAMQVNLVIMDLFIGLIYQAYRLVLYEGVQGGMGCAGRYGVCRGEGQRTALILPYVCMCCQKRNSYAVPK